ncbi:hypothetical protein B0H16DRAFT_1480320 [Mycena metata]|uniref:Uncharacterized protein n=1 Tax=Mycena metata TaxID=1033252 RepID=A0AAD7H3I5_9AGAR|nr:hypothetical protein B0H16DRAFT_1480320 [Mycena metata]
MDFPDQVFWRQQHDFAPKYTHTIRGSSLQRESTRDFSTTNTKFREQEERIREEPDLRPGQSTTNYLEGEQQLIFDGVFIVIKGGREDRCSNEEIILVPHLYTREILRRKLLRVEFSKMWCGMHMNKSVTERRRYACPWSFTCDKQQQSAPKMFAQVWVNQSAGFFQVLSIQQHALGRFVGLEVRPNDDESTMEEWLSGKRHRDELEAEKHCREELKVKSAHSGGSKERLTGGERWGTTRVRAKARRIHAGLGTRRYPHDRASAAVYARQRERGMGGRRHRVRAQGSGKGKGGAARGSTSPRAGVSVRTDRVRRRAAHVGMRSAPMTSGRVSRQRKLIAARSNDKSRGGISPRSGGGGEGGYPAKKISHHFREDNDGRREAHVADRVLRNARSARQCRRCCRDLRRRWCFRGAGDVRDGGGVDEAGVGDGAAEGGGIGDAFGTATFRTANLMSRNFNSLSITTSDELIQTNGEVLSMGTGNSGHPSFRERWLKSGLATFSPGHDELNFQYLSNRACAIFGSNYSLRARKNLQSHKDVLKPDTQSFIVLHHRCATSILLETMEYTVDSDVFDYNWLALSTNVINACAGKKLLLGYAWTMAVLGIVQLVIRLVDTVLIARGVEILVKQDSVTSQPKLAKLALLSRSLDTAQTVILAGNNLPPPGQLTVIAMVLESGAAYFVVSVLLAIFDSDSSGITFNVLESIAIHIVNIAATLIIVRVGLGQNIQDTGKTHPAEEARNTRLQPRAEFSAHQTRSPIPPVLDIKASEDSLTA